MPQRTIEEEMTFDELVDLYNEIKLFKIDKSITILDQFHTFYDTWTTKLPKFKPTVQETAQQDRLNLSSTIVCIHALSQYHKSWEYNNKLNLASQILIDQRSNRVKLEDYCASINFALNDAISSKRTDLFSLLNTMSLLKAIEVEAKESLKNSHTPIKPELIETIINEIINNYSNNYYSRWDNIHPFIYYKFLRVIESWKPEKFNDIFDIFYRKGKHEMYRQIVLYDAGDHSLFDVKRLIYSLLVVTIRKRYSNNLVKNMALDIIFKLNNGLWPSGQMVDVNSESAPNIIITNPILSSVECLNDMMMHEGIKEDLTRFRSKLHLTYEWIIKRLRIDPVSKNPAGWYPEYEGPKIPKSWVAAHTLMFLKNYCEMISQIINAPREVIRFLPAVSSSEYSQETGFSRGSAAQASARRQEFQT